jgi:hypothetical protein
MTWTDPNKSRGPKPKPRLGPPAPVRRRPALGTSNPGSVNGIPISSYNAGPVETRADGTTFQHPVTSGFAQAYRAGAAGARPPAPTAPTGPGPGGGGGGGGYGGGGGGGGADPAAALRNAQGILALLGSSQLQHQATPFDAGMYDKQRGSIGSAVTADRGASDQAYQQLIAQMTGQYKNAFAAGAPQRATAMAPDMSALLRAQGADPAQYQSQVAAQNQVGQQGDAVFGDLFRTLAANADQGQQSRLAEAQQAQTYSGREIDAQQLGLLAGVDARQGQASQQWQMQQDQLKRDSIQQRLQLALPMLQQLAAAGLDMPTLEQMGLA